MPLWYLFKKIMKILVTENQLELIVGNFINESFKDAPWHNEDSTIDMTRAILAAKKVLSEDGVYIKKMRNSSGYRSNLGDATSDKMEIFFYQGGAKRLTPDNKFVKGFINFVKELKPGSAAIDILRGLFKKTLYRLNYAKEKNIPLVFFKDKKDDEIRHVDFGVLAWGVSLYMNIDADKTPEKQFLGVVGEPHFFPFLKVVDIKKGKGSYGDWILYIMKDKEGNSVGKFGNIEAKYKIEGDIWEDVEVDDVVSFEGVIKSHDDKYGKKQTMVGKLLDSKESKMKTIVIYIWDEEALGKINVDGALKNLLPEDLKMGENVMRVDNETFSKIIDNFPPIDGFEIEIR